MTEIENQEVEKTLDVVPEVVEAPKEPLTLREEIEASAKEVKERLRDESGKFAKVKEEIQVEKEKEITPPEPKITQPEPKIDPPAAYSAAVKAKWGELPLEIRQELAKRERDVEIGFTKLHEDRNYGKQIKDIVNPYMAMIQSEGSTPAAAINSLLNTAYVLRTASPQQKGQLLLQLAHQFGADMQQAIQQQGSTPQLDPRLHQMQQELQSLKGTIEQQEQLKRQQEQESINGQIAAFAADPKNVHFEAVKAHMASLLQNGLAKDLQDAYDQAVYANPTTRSTILQTQHVDAEQKRLAEAKAKAEAAKRAGASIKGGAGSSGTMNGAIPDRSLRDELLANLRAVQGQA